MCEKDLVPNEKGWYTYQGKLVVATATTYLQKSYGTIPGKRYFKYYDTFTININGVDYSAIVLDSCGAAMKSNIIDLYVVGPNSGVGKIKVSIH